MNQYVFEEERPVVDTKCGKIRGIAYGGVNIFMGIDYAKAKRFQMPVEIEPWEGIKNAYQHGPISKQVLKLKPFYTYRGLHMLERSTRHPPSAETPIARLSISPFMEPSTVMSLSNLDMRTTVSRNMPLSAIHIA